MSRLPRIAFRQAYWAIVQPLCVEGRDVVVANYPSLREESVLAVLREEIDAKREEVRAIIARETPPGGDPYVSNIHRFLEANPFAPLMERVVREIWKRIGTTS